MHRDGGDVSPRHRHVLPRRNKLSGLLHRADGPCLSAAGAVGAVGAVLAASPSASLRRLHHTQSHGQGLPHEMPHHGEEELVPGPMS